MEVGFVLTNVSIPAFGPYPPKPSKASSLFGPWAKSFEPDASTNKFVIPADWVKFFAALLHSPSHFSCAKELLSSSSLISWLNDGSGLELSLPR